MKELTEWSLSMWRDLHEKGYFPNSRQHKEWRICETMPDWFLRLAAPSQQDRALEIGAGYGEWMVPLSKLVAHVVGVDIHPIPVLKAAEIFQREGIANATMILSDGMTLPFDDNSFSLVYSISVFQHLPRAMVKGYLAETDRVLETGGRAVHYFRSLKPTANGSSRPVKDFVIGENDDFSCGWTEEEIAEAVESLGWDFSIHDLGLWLILVGRPQ